MTTATTIATLIIQADYDGALDAYCADESYTDADALNAIYSGMDLIADNAARVGDSDFEGQPLLTQDERSDRIRRLGKFARKVFPEFAAAQRNA